MITVRSGQTELEWSEANPKSGKNYGSAPVGVLAGGVLTKIDTGKRRA
jgi:hypothetical protein